MATFDFLVDSTAAGMRLDAFLAAQHELPSRAACVRLIEDGLVSINSTPATDKSERLQVGDRISLDYTAPEPVGALAPNFSIPLDIRFEDEHLLVLSKQAGLVCHPAPGHTDDTLCNALVAREGYEHLGLLQGIDRPGIVHRLDMDTSGLMLAAKDDATQQALMDMLRVRTLDRRYVTLVRGYVARDEDSIVTGIERSTRDGIRMTVSRDPQSREAITTYRVLERFEAGPKDEGYSLLECHLYTGRTHQIRVHMRHIGHAVVGDPMYGYARDPLNAVLSRQFLHSWRLSFTHPISEKIGEFFDTLPEDLAALLCELAPRSLGRSAAGTIICPKLIR